MFHFILFSPYQKKLRCPSLSMFRSLTIPSGASLPLITQNPFSSTQKHRSDRNMSFSCRKPCKAMVHAFTEAACPVKAIRPASLYEVLRVKQDASPLEIKAAYRSLAKLYHPDASSAESDGRDFMEIHNAYATLSDPAARALYDLSLVAGQRSFAYSAGNRPSFYRTRRWETDQCW